MPIKVHINVTIRKVDLDARDLVEDGADAGADAMREALIDGVSPVDGTPRAMNSRGRPEGYRTGRLANGLHRSGVSGSKSVATAKVKSPANRAGWVASRGDIVVASGRVGEAIQEATDEYVAKAVSG